MENRIPNTFCANCQRPIYRTPLAIETWTNIFCSRSCRGQFQRKENPEIACEVCSKIFNKTKKTQKYCSKKCSGFATRNRNSDKLPYKSQSGMRYLLLKSKFGFSSCMIKGCEYNKTYDIHRLIEGKNGGEYEIGNMFAICPNHHAEIHRSIIKVDKVNDYTLEIRRVD